MPKLEISEDIIQRTKYCNSNFSCLNYEDNPKCRDGLALCPVEYKIGDGIFVDCNNDFSCTYKIPFGTDYSICKCPVRYEIYERYKM